MIKFEYVEVVGLEAANRGMRNPMNSWEKSDSGSGCSINSVDRRCAECDRFDTEYEYGLCRPEKFIIGPNDLDLMKRLRNAGTDHRKFMRMIVVYVDITAPLYWWKEFDTYKVGTVANSCSTMHKIAEKKFTADDFSYEHLDDIFDYEPEIRDMAPVIEFVTHTDTITNYILGPDDIFSLSIKMLNRCRELYLQTKDKKYWWQMIQLLPSSYNQKRTVMLNYEVLANIYKSRKDHKLDEWHELCDWIKRLPYSELITGFDVDILHPISRKDSEND